MLSECWPNTLSSRDCQVKRIPNLSISVTLVTEMVVTCKNIEKLYMCNMDTLGSISIGLIIKVSTAVVA